jgi:hypothetical protein
MRVAPLEFSTLTSPSGLSEKLSTRTEVLCACVVEGVKIISDCMENRTARPANPDRVLTNPFTRVGVFVFITSLRLLNQG